MLALCNQGGLVDAYLTILVTDGMVASKHRQAMGAGVLQLWPRSPAALEVPCCVIPSVVPHAVWLAVWTCTLSKLVLTSILGGGQEMDY